MEPGGLPKWARDAIAAGLFVFFALYVIVAFLDAETRSRFEAAGQAVSVVAVLAAVAAALIAVRQGELQRVALEEQHRAFELGRLANMRGEYARWLGAAHDVFKARLAEPLDAHRLPDKRAYEQGVASARAEMVKLSLQIGLHDRNGVRREIRGQLSRALAAGENSLRAVLTIVTFARKLRETANAIDPVEPGKLGEIDSRSEKLVGARSEADLDGISRDDVNALRSVSIYFAQLAVRASFAADEAALGLAVVGQNVNEDEANEGDA